MTRMITVNDLTIRQAKKLGKAVGVKGFSKMTIGPLIEAIKLAEPDADKLQMMVTQLVAAPEQELEEQDAERAEIAAMTADELERARLEALREIARACGRRIKAEDELRGRREQLNQEVAEARANFKGAMERGVDYDDHESVRDKLEAVTDAYQNMLDTEEHRRQELEPLKEKLSKARAAERKAFEDSKQLKIRF